jgi:hypothetical protein
VTGRTSRAWAAVLVVALLAVVSGCGSNDETTTTTAAAAVTAEWADGLCASLVAWRSSIKSATASVKSGDVSGTSLQETADSISTANDDLVSDLEGLGTPPTPGADEAKATTDEFVNEAQSESEEITDAATNVSSVSDLPGAVADITASLATISKDLASTVTKLKTLPNSEWDQAFAQSQDCDELTNR